MEGDRKLDKYLHEFDRMSRGGAEKAVCGMPGKPG
jgi:hypothetical protein